MTAPHRKLARSLELLRGLQRQGKVAIRTSELPRIHRDRLLENGFIRAVMKGWYTPSRPDELEGESTAWFASFWDFCAAYLTVRFGDSWSLSPEQSLKLHSGNKTVPLQLFVRAPKASGNITKLLHGTSLVDVAATVPKDSNMTTAEGMRVYSLPAALIAVSADYFFRNSTDARTILAMVADASDVLDLLLEGGHPVVAGRLAGAFRNIGRTRLAEDILKAMRSAGYDARENDPFEDPTPFTISQRIKSPHAGRIRIMWNEIRAVVLYVFPKAPGRPENIASYLTQIEEIYVTDAYHSLSIEGYRVSAELIDRVRAGAWNPGKNKNDREHQNAMAARGYWQASRAVRDSIRRILTGEIPGKVAHEDHGGWYREMFTPGVQAGILKSSDLAGYRNNQVYIGGSMHVPPSHEGMRDAMPVFFDLLQEEG